MHSEVPSSEGQLDLIGSSGPDSSHEPAFKMAPAIGAAGPLFVPLSHPQVGGSELVPCATS